MIRKIVLFLLFFSCLLSCVTKPIFANDAPFCPSTYHLCQCAPDGTIWYPGGPVVYKCCLNTIIGERIGINVCLGSVNNLVPFDPPSKAWDINAMKSVCSSSGGVKGFDTAIGCVPTDDLQAFLKFVLKFAFFASGGIIALMIISTGYTLMTSQGNPEKLQAAKENVVALFSGLVLIAFSLTLLQIIGADILNLPTFR